ncbi:MAG: hypothetical protein WCF67_15905 [Chitinophagaceae bacterium]
MLSDNDKIKNGQIKFLSACPPPLTAGEYAIRAKQTVKIPDEKNKDGKPTEFNKNTTAFWIGAPRFALNPDDVYSVYPPASGTGSYFYSLPHIVLNRKTLPWERTIDGSVAGDGEIKPPWIALLLLDEDEIKEHDITLQNVLLKEIFAPPQDAKKIAAPAIAKEPWDNDEINKSVADEKGAPRYNVIDLPKDLFKDIVPYKEELPYLAHARQVDTGNKEMDINAKGWFSVIICNRVPEKDKANSAFLVSLEGYDRYLSKNSVVTEDSIRLVVLSHWSFEAKGLDYESLVRKLNDEAGLYRINTGAPVNNAAVQQALHYGYTALNHDFRHGAKSISWYRGPLAPANIAKPPHYTFNSGDGALRFDEDTGMFDVSYAAAWQAGRLLALENPGFAEALNNWKNTYAKDFRMDVAKQLLQQEFKGRIDFTIEDDTQTISPDGKLNFSAALHKMESDDLMKNLLLEIWNQNMK